MAHSSLWFAGMLLSLAPSAACATSLQLICKGGGGNTIVRHSSTSDDIAVSSSGFDDEVRVEINGPDGRVRVPKAMLPQEYSGGDDGWWKINDLTDSPDAINGRLRFNFLNKPTLSIDRRTGRIAIDAGRSHFYGQCEKLDPAAKPKF